MEKSEGTTIKVKTGCGLYMSRSMIPPPNRFAARIGSRVRARGVRFQRMSPLLNWLSLKGVTLEEIGSAPSIASAMTQRQAVTGCIRGRCPNLPPESPP